MYFTCSPKLPDGSLGMLGYGTMQTHTFILEATTQKQQIHMKTGWSFPTQTFHRQQQNSVNTVQDVETHKTQAVRMKWAHNW